jgi:hypothetical protein
LLSFSTKQHKTKQHERFLVTNVNGPGLSIYEIPEAAVTQHYAENE